MPLGSVHGLSNKRSVMSKLLIVPNELKQEIIEKWKTKKLNSIKEIAKEVDLKPSRVNSVINEYLSNVSLSK
ncbi:hypothetical protein D3C85_702210 [compost metagenome]